MNTLPAHLPPSKLTFATMAKINTPRTNYGRLRDVGIQHHDPKTNWALRPRDPHTKAQRKILERRYAEQKGADIIAEFNAALASLVSKTKEG